MAARDLRYAWFQELGFDKIATAHHQDDNIETLYLRKSKSKFRRTLWNSVKNGNIIRPLLCFSAQEIESHLLQNEWSWREDVSNASTNYQRNEIRLLQLPSLEKKIQISARNCCRNRTQSAKIRSASARSEAIVSFIWKNSDSYREMYIKDLLNHPQRKELIYELLKEYGPFPWHDVFALMTAESGKEIRNQHFRLIKNRDSLLLVTNKIGQQESVQIDESICDIKVPIPLRFNVLKRGDVMDFSTASVAMIDFNKLSFPLTLRKWKKGDLFIPLGMQGHKKISDFMVDEKLSILEKENIWVYVQMMI